MNTKSAMLHTRLLFCFVGCLSSVTVASAADVVSDGKILDNLLKGYDARFLPDTKNATITTVNILIRLIKNVDHKDMKFTTQVTFREQWTDSRLAYGRREVRADWPDTPSDDTLPSFVVVPAWPPNQQQHIWMPDTFFQNEIASHRHEMEKPNSLVRIYKDGSILYSTRLTLELSCPMYLHRYPHDTQWCTIELASYAHTSDLVDYKWKSGTPIQLKRGLNGSVPSFILEGVNTDDCSSCTNTGCYACLRATFQLRRINTYASFWCAILTVAFSFATFYLDAAAVPARVTILLLTSIALMAQVLAIVFPKTYVATAGLPVVSYTTALDVWLGIQWFFLAATLLEFAVVSWLAKNYVASADKTFTGFWTDQEIFRKVDIVSRVVFPVLYLVILLIYYIAFAAF